MAKLEEDLAPHAKGVDVALAAFGVGKGSAKMPEKEVRKRQGAAAPAVKILEYKEMEPFFVAGDRDAP